MLTSTEVRGKLASPGTSNGDAAIQSHRRCSDGCGCHPVIPARPRTVPPCTWGWDSCGRHGKRGGTLGSRSKSLGSRSKSLGWKPSRGSSHPSTGVYKNYFLALGFNSSNSHIRRHVFDGEGFTVVNHHPTGLDRRFLTLEALATIIITLEAGLALTVVTIAIGTLAILGSTLYFRLSGQDCVLYNVVNFVSITWSHYP